MLNPFGSEPVPGSYSNLHKRMRRKVQAQVGDHIVRLITEAYESALASENIVLSRPERKRLLGQLARLMLEDAIKKLDDDSASA